MLVIKAFEILMDDSYKINLLNQVIIKRFKTNILFSGLKVTAS